MNLKLLSRLSLIISIFIVLARLFVFKDTIDENGFLHEHLIVSVTMIISIIVTAFLNVIYVIRKTKDK